MDDIKLPVQGQAVPQGATAPTGATGATEAAGPTVGREITDQLPESQRNYSGNLGDDTVGGPGAGTPPGNTSQRDATGGGGVSTTGSAAGAPVPTSKPSFHLQGDSGMGAAGSSADINAKEFADTHEEDGSLKADEQKKVDEQVAANNKAREDENKRILEK